MAKNKLVAPVVKWVGGKRQLLDEITPLLPKRITSYCEPFLGGGAVLFSIQPSKAIVNDLNGDLIAVYEIIFMGQSFIKSAGLIWPLFYTAVFYLAFCGLLTLIFRWAEKKMSYFE